MLELKLQNTVLLTVFGGRSRRIRKQVFIPFVIGDDCFGNAFLVSDQPVEPSLIGADFLREYGSTINFKTNCLTYEMEGYTKECKFTNNVETQQEQQKNFSHGLPETADDDVMQNPGEELVWTVRRYMRVVDRNYELYDEIAEKQIKSLDIDTKSEGKEYAPLLSEVLRINTNNNTCYEADNVKSTKRRMEEYCIDYCYQEESGGVSVLERDLCENNKAELTDPRQILEVDL
jgi:hypothetical protein